MLLLMAILEFHLLMVHLDLVQEDILPVEEEDFTVYIVRITLDLVVMVVED